MGRDAHGTEAGQERQCRWISMSREGGGSQEKAQDVKALASRSQRGKRNDMLFREAEWVASKPGNNHPEIRDRGCRQGCTGLLSTEYDSGPSVARLVLGCRISGLWALSTLGASGPCHDKHHCARSLGHGTCCGGEAHLAGRVAWLMGTERAFLHGEISTAPKLAWLISGKDKLVLLNLVFFPDGIHYGRQPEHRHRLSSAEANSPLTRACLHRGLCCLQLPIVASASWPWARGGSFC